MLVSALSICWFHFVTDWGLPLPVSRGPWWIICSAERFISHWDCRPGQVLEQSQLGGEPGGPAVTRVTISRHLCLVSPVMSHAKMGRDTQSGPATHWLGHRAGGQEGRRAGGAMIDWGQFLLFSLRSGQTPDRDTGHQVSGLETGDWGPHFTWHLDNPRDLDHKLSIESKYLLSQIVSTYYLW